MKASIFLGLLASQIGPGMITSSTSYLDASLARNPGRKKDVMHCVVQNMPSGKKLGSCR